jgi:acyl carrier protein
MTVQSPAATPNAALRAELCQLLGEVTGAGADWVAAFGEQARLESDLRLESVELADLAMRVQERYDVDLFAQLAELDLDALIGLTLADLTAFVADR